MASVVLSGDTSGTITISAPAVSGSNTQTLVATTGTLAPIVSGTAVASTSGTSIDFTSIPSWVKRITVMFSGVSTNGTSRVMLQLGSTSFTTTGYISSASQITSGTPTSASNTTGFIIDDISNAAGVRSGNVVFTLVTGNTWVESSVMGRSDTTGTNFSGGYIALGGTLDRVRITTVNGTDTFDAGTINILYE